MTAFQQFRLWGRRAPLGERIAAAVGAALAVAVLAYLVVPASPQSSSTLLQSPDTSSVTGSTATTGSSQTSSTTGTTTGSTPQAGPATTGGAHGGTSGGTVLGGASGAGATGGGSAGTTSGGGCVSPPGTDQGITSTQIKMAIILFQISGSFGNQALNLPPADVQQRYYQIVTNSINAQGGVACRKLVPVFFTVNPLDQSDLQQKCLDVADAGVFMAIDDGGYSTTPALLSCFAQHQIPLYDQLPIADKIVQGGYPYLFAEGSLDQLYRNTVFALKQRGFFDPAKGFVKVGYLYRNCNPEIPGLVQGWLKQAGVASGAIVTFNEGCSAGDNPANDQQAVLTFQRAGVTHVIQTQADWSDFTRIAQQQGFKPKYGLPDDPVVAVTYGSTHPDYANLADAITITSYRTGEERTPGYPLSAGTLKCNAIMKAAGQPPVYEQPVGQGGFACDQLWQAAAMIRNAPMLKRTSLVDGLRATKTLDFSYPMGPPDFSGVKVTVGGQTWRPLQFLSSCNCWRVVDRNFHPAFS